MFEWAGGNGKGIIKMENEGKSAEGEPVVLSEHNTIGWDAIYHRAVAAAEVVDGIGGAITTYFGVITGDPAVLQDNVIVTFAANRRPTGLERKGPTRVLSFRTGEHNPHQRSIVSLVVGSDTL